MISQLLERIFPWTQTTKTGTQAKQRLKLVLAHDRTSLTPDLVENMRQGILEVIEQYVELDVDDTQFSVQSDLRTTALTASFPIRRLKRTEEVIPLDDPQDALNLALPSLSERSNCITVTVPATTANLGPGFDCLGAALTLYNQFKFTKVADQTEAVTFKVTGQEAEGVTTDDSNLAYRAFLHLFNHIQRTPPPIHLEIDLGVPLARGLGSSATAIVGGLLGANHFVEKPLSQGEIMELAIALEGHPDNVVPALLGGCRLATATDQPNKSIEVALPWHPDLVPVVAIPDFELSTEAARSVLPNYYSRKDALYNLAHLGLLLRGLEAGEGEWLKVAMQDRIHQPYRQKLIKGYKEVREAAQNAGAYGVVISGAGPTLLALTDRTQASAVAEVMQQAWSQVEVKAQTFAVSLDSEGAKLN
jgi:homoserine kinase